MKPIPEFFNTAKKCLNEIANNEITIEQAKQKATLALESIEQYKKHIEDAIKDHATDSAFLSLEAKLRLDKMTDD